LISGVLMLLRRRLLENLREDFVPFRPHVYRARMGGGCNVFRRGGGLGTRHSCSGG
jgi:hypothetical protein